MPPPPDDTPRDRRAPTAPSTDAGARATARRRRRLPTWATALIGVASLVLATAALAAAVDGGALRATLTEMTEQPARVVLALGAFGLAFVIRAGVWVRVLPDLPFRQALAALHLSLGANHVLPLRLGEPLRVVSVVRRTSTTTSAATATTVALRSADLVAVVVLGALLAPGAVGELLGPWGWAAVGAVAALGIAGLAWLVVLARRKGRLERIRVPGPIVAAGTIAAWLAESVLVWQSAHFAGLEVTYAQAVLVTAVAVASQMAAVAPSGIGTYEAASVAAWATFGHDPGTALVAAIGAHALKTAYSLVAGAIAVVTPAPSMLGRLRLPRTTTARGAVAGRVHDPADGPAPGLAPDAPVVLFLPAHDEAGTVADVVGRCPATVQGHPVRCLVVDDGSSDGTGELARAAGAEVVRHDPNQGLGAAVRTGFAWAVDRGAAAVAFCDADGEYAPEELARLVGPVLAGEADYVVGSRFAGDIRSMHPHRRFGNVVLTRWVRWTSRLPVTDGQSGYRALSAAAAADAEVIHDFNYAQVLTLDLVGKGYRYAEVPITYAFRTEGRSFIRLGRYLRAVVPAVWREVNEVADPAPAPAPAPTPVAA